MRRFYYFICLFVFVIGANVNAANVTLTVNAYASPATGGFASVSDGGTYSGRSTLGWTGYSTISHTFSLSATEEPGYTFKGWATEQTVNSGTMDNPYSVTLSQQGGLWDQAKTETYFAIFAKMVADEDVEELAFGQILKNNSKTLSIDVTHVHAGTITAAISGDDAGVVTVSKNASISSNQDETTTTIEVTYTPTTSETEVDAELVITSNNGLSELRIPVSGYCPPQLTPSFSLEKEEFELDETVAFTFSEFTNPQVTIANEAIVSYDAENHTLTGMALGSTTVTLTQEETGEVLPAEKVFTVTVTKIDPYLNVTEAGYAKTDISVLPNGQTTIGFSTRSDAPISFSQVSGTEYVAYNADSKVLSALAKGVSVFTLSQPETDRYKAAEKIVNVLVKTKYHVPVTVDQSLFEDKTFKTSQVGNNNTWDNTNQITLGSVGNDGLDFNDRAVILHFEGIPNKLTFEIAIPTNPGYGIGALLGGVTNVEWYVQESETETMPNEQVWTSSYDGTTFKSYEVQLQPTTRYVKLCYSGNFGAYFRNVKISELSYIEEPSSTAVDFGTATINSGEVSKEVNINWCNIAPLTVVSSNPRFSVSPSAFGDFDERGSQTITISYTHTNEAGSNDGDITISNAAYSQTIHVSAVTTKRPQEIVWNPAIAATGFAMNVEEFFPNESITSIATTANQGTIVYSSSDPGKIKVSEDGQILVALAAGEVQITATQAGDDEYESITDTKTFVVTNLQKQTIDWNQNLLTLLTTDDTVHLTARASGGGEIVYTSSDETVVSVINNILTIVGEGNAVVTASQEGDEQYLAISQTNNVIVRNPAAQCNEQALSVNSLTLRSGHLQQELNLEGTPTKLTFYAMHGTKPNGAWNQQPTYANLTVDQYAKIEDQWGWYVTEFNQKVTTTSTRYEVELDNSATKIRFRTTEDETTHTITSIQVPRAKYLTADVEIIDLDIESNAIWSKNITISHSNIDLMTVVATKGILTLSSTTIGKGCGDFGDDVLTVSFTPMEKYKEYVDTIVITDGKAEPSTIVIPVRLYSRGLNQLINTFNLPKACVATDIVHVSAIASSELEVTFISSDSTIAYVNEEKQLVILSSGTVDITARQEGNEKFDIAEQTKTIIISKAETSVTIAPTAMEISYGEALGASELANGEGSVAGSFAWADATKEMNVGVHSETVVFTPTDTARYAISTTQVEVTVAKANQVIVWEQELPATLEVDDHMLQLQAEAVLEVYYTSSDSTIAYVDADNYVVALKPGEVTITARQDGDETHKAAEPVSKTLTVVAKENTGTATAVEDVNGEKANGEWTKVLRNGQVLIIRNSKTYTIIGELLR